MEQIRKIPQQVINKVRNSPQTSGLAFEKYGKHSDINKYSDREITEMLYGIYTDSKTILVDGDYFVNLNEVVEIVCVLDKATYYKRPTAEDFKTNAHNIIRNIRTFYVKDYFLVTSNPVAGQTRHKITNHLSKIGAIQPGRNEFSGLFSKRNHYQTLQHFKQGLFPKDLYHPIKRHINGQFFNDDYRLSDFKVETDFVVEKSN